eukprot:scaffold6163_cov78-Cylindrotheca_fusiformis.AAC.2
MALCGLNDVNQFKGETNAQRIASQVFSDDFASCMDKSFDDLTEDLKSFSCLTAAQGQIRLVPGVRRKIQDYIQWVRNLIRTDRDPSSVAFPVDDTSTLLHQYKVHGNFIKQSESIAQATKPEPFTADLGGILEPYPWCKWPTAGICRET